MTAFVNHFAFEARTVLRNKMLMLLNYLFPLGFYAMMGLIMVGINPGFAETMTPAMAMFAIIAAAILGLPEPLVSGREAGIYRSYRIIGVPAISIVSIHTFTTMLHTAVATGIIAVTGPVLFGASPISDLPNFILVFVLAAFACAGLGVLIGVISAASRLTVLWSQLIFLPSMLLSGLMLPFDLLPEGARRVGLLLPATHAMNAFRALAMDMPADFDPQVSLLVLAAGGSVAVGLAVYLFNWDRRNATQRGHPAMALLALVPYLAGALLLS